MIRKTVGIIMGSVLALVVISFVPSARAGIRDQLVQFTFDQPVQIPNNTVLPAGTYWFVMPGYVQESQEVMQVFNADRTQLLDTFQTFAIGRPTWASPTNMGYYQHDPSNVKDKEITFAKLSPNGPMMLIGWFYPYETEGHRLIYSPRREKRIAEANLITVVVGKAAQVG